MTEPTMEYVRSGSRYVRVQRLMCRCCERVFERAVKGGPRPERCPACKRHADAMAARKARKKRGADR